MHAFVFGEIGLLPHEYYCLLLHELNCLVEGYNTRRYQRSDELRRATFLQLLPHVKQLNYDNFCRDYWPLQLDKHRDGVIDIDPVPDKETWEEIKKQMQGTKAEGNEYERILKTHNL